MSEPRKVATNSRRPGRRSGLAARPARMTRSSGSGRPLAPRVGVGQALRDLLFQSEIRVPGNGGDPVTRWKSVAARL